MDVTFDLETYTTFQVECRLQSASEKMIIYDPFHIFPNLKKYTRDLHLLQLQDMFLQAIAYYIIANTHFKQKIENFQEFPIMNALVLSVCSDEFERNRTNSNVQKTYTPQ